MKLDKYLKKKEYRKIRLLFDIVVVIMNFFFYALILSLISKLKGELAGLETVFFIVVTMMQIGFTYHLLFSNKLFNGLQSSERIYSVKREKDIEGSFVLGCGSINSVNYYYFYEDGEFGKKISKVQVGELEIIETNNYKPSIKEIMIEGNLKKFMFVPKNTIKEEFKL